MNLYLFSLAYLFLINSIFTKLFVVKAKRNGYLIKAKKQTNIVTKVVTLPVFFCPIINTLFAIALTFHGLNLLKNEEKMKRFYRENMNFPNEIIHTYENAISKETLKEALILDGATEIEAKEEIDKAKSYLKSEFFVKEKESELKLGMFNEKEYTWAKIENDAETLLQEITLFTSLDEKQKIALLSILRDDLRKELKNKESSNTQEKLLKIIYGQSHN